LDFKQFRYFIAVADEQHMGRAADKIRVAQPALSQQIKLLERRLGTLLFDREKRGLRLTEAGGEFLVHARLAVQQADLALELGRRAGLGQVGRLEFGYIDSTAYNVPWQRILAEFRAEYPDVEILLHNASPAELIVMLEQGLLDAATVRAPLPEMPRGFTAERIHREKLFVALPQAHRLAAHESISLERLAGEDVMTTAGDVRAGFAALVTSLFANANVPVKITERARLASTLIPLVAAGLGIAIIPDVLIGMRMNGVVVRPLASKIRSEVHIVHRVNEKRPVPLAFLRSIRRTLDGLASRGENVAPA
jgi:DNA-binding transcriptional LysR family regulator